jgi:hypothetical protein
VLDRIRCITSRHRWDTSWDYFAGVIHIRATCSRCGAAAFEAVDLVPAGARPGAGQGVEYSSPFGVIGPILWDDQSTWSSGWALPPALLTYQAF